MFLKNKERENPHIGSYVDQIFDHQPKSFEGDKEMCTCCHVICLLHKETLCYSQSSAKG